MLDLCIHKRQKLVQATQQSSYGWVASIYDALAMLYTGGGIRQSKLQRITTLRPGMRVLFAGVGNGEDALAAREQGAEATLLDLSASMLARASARLERSPKGPNAGSTRIVQQNLLEHDEIGSYDVVVAHYFLNVFGAESQPDIVAHLNALLRPGGMLWIADFSPPNRSVVKRICQHIYYAGPLVFFCVATGNAWHGLYDHGPVLERAGLRVSARDGVRIFGAGPRWLESICAHKYPYPNQATGDVPAATAPVSATYRILIDSHLWTASVVSALSHAATLEMGLRPSWLPITTVFFATLLIYNVDRVFDVVRMTQLRPMTAAGPQQPLRAPLRLCAIGLAGLAGALLFSPWPAIALVLSGTILCSMYGAPIRRAAAKGPIATATSRRIKDLPGLKAWIVGLAVTVATIWVPLAYQPRDLAPTVPLALIFLALTITNAHLFDLRDLAADRAQGVRTLPVLIGTRSTRIFLTMLVLLCSLLAYLLPLVMTPPTSTMTPDIMIIGGVLLMSIWTLNERSPRWRFGVFVDGLLLLPLALYWLGNEAANQ